MKLVVKLLVFACVYAFTSAIAEEREFSDVTITESQNDDHSEFANILLDTLVKKAILDESDASRILAAFDVKGVHRNPAEAQAFTKTSISTLTLRGDGDAAKKFVARLSSLFDKEEQKQHLIEYLLELVLDNALVDGQAAANLAAANGYGVKIQLTKYSSSTQELEGKAVKNKECCVKNLAPLIEGIIGTDENKMYYRADVDALKGWTVNSAIGRVALARDACSCDGTELQPVYWTGKAFSQYYTTSVEDGAKMQAQGYLKPTVAFYCAKTQGKCGATEPLRRYMAPFAGGWPGDRLVLITNEEEGKKRVAQGWRDGSILCYVWPKIKVIE